MSVRKALLSDFADYTSAHGLASIKRAPSLFGKILWVIFLLAAWFAMSYQVYVAIYKFFLYETTVSVQVAHSNSLNFPAVTVCNLNAIRMTKLAGVPEFVFLMTALTAPSSKDPFVGQNAERQTSLTAEDGKLAMYHYSIYQWNMDIKNLGHQMEDMMVECTFQGMQCFPSNFTRWSHGTYGNCYTLFVPEGYSSFVGPSYGLALTLYTEDDTEYINSVASAAGFRVVVHQPEYIPFPEDRGFTISPGFLTSVAFTQRYIHRQPLPYDNSDCGTQKMEYKNRYNLLWEQFRDEGLIKESNYTNAACTKDCYQNHLHRECGCLDASSVTREIIQANNATPEPNLNEVDLADQYPPCDFSNTSTLSCIMKKTLDINKQGLCDYPICMQACDEFNILSTVTTSFWPLEPYYQSQKENWEQRLRKNLTSGHTGAREHMVKLEVFFEELNYESIVESPALDTWALLSSVGGTMGLYGGLSFLTLIEFVELGIWLLTKKESLVGDGGDKEFNG